MLVRKTEARKIVNCIRTFEFKETPCNWSGIQNRPLMKLVKCDNNVSDQGFGNSSTNCTGGTSGYFPSFLRLFQADSMSYCKKFFFLIKRYQIGAEGNLFRHILFYLHYKELEGCNFATIMFKRKALIRINEILDLEHPV